MSKKGEFKVVAVERPRFSNVVPGREYWVVKDGSDYRASRIRAGLWIDPRDAVRA
jgi:hypothetical protein